MVIVNHCHEMICVITQYFLIKNNMNFAISKKYFFINNVLMLCK